MKIISVPLEVYLAYFKSLKLGRRFIDEDLAKAGYENVKILPHGFKIKKKFDKLANPMVVKEEKRVRISNLPTLMFYKESFD